MSGTNPYDAFLGQYAAAQRQQQQQAQYYQQPGVIAAAQQQEAAAQLYLAQAQAQAQAHAGNSYAASLLGATAAAASGTDSYAQILQAAGFGAGGAPQAQAQVQQVAGSLYGQYQPQQHPALAAAYPANAHQIQQMQQEQLIAALQQQQQQPSAVPSAGAAGVGQPIALGEAERAALLLRSAAQEDAALLARYPHLAGSLQQQQQAAGGVDYAALGLGHLLLQQQQQQLPQPQKPTPQHPTTVSAATAKQKKASPVSATAATTTHPPSTALPEWYTKCTELGLPEDRFWLSELQCFLRANFCEVFCATQQDLQVHAYSGRNKPIVLGQVGVRCKYCKNLATGAKAPQSVSYPSQLTGIYNSVQQMFRLHLDVCQAIPHDVRKTLESLKDSSSSRGGRKQYWIDSAKRLGLVDTEHGIYFSRDPTKPPPVEDAADGEQLGTDAKAPAGATDDNDLATDTAASGGPDGGEGGTVDGENGEKGGQGASLPSRGKYISPDSGWERAVLEEKRQSYPLVLEEDSPLISDFLYLTMQQMEPCKMMGPDRVGCYKGRPLGFRGLACRHCIGQAGSGRYFPASEASLSQTTTSQTILNHVRNCRMVPASIREELEDMKKSKIGEKGKKVGRPKHGGRKIFFHRLWCRVQGLPIRENAGGTPAAAAASSKSGGRKKKATATGIARGGGEDKNKSYSSDEHNSADSDDNDTDDEANLSDSIRGTKNMTAFSNPAHAMMNGNDGSESEDGYSSGDEVTLCYSCIDSTKDVGTRKHETGFCWTGTASIRLAKGDDPLFLSERHCFMRGEMLEAFASQEETDEVQLGQAGVRCVFCAEASPEARSEEYMCYPPSLSSFYEMVTKFHREHLKVCPNIAEEVKATFLSLKGMESSRDADETKQFWADSLRELGVSDHPKIMGYRRPCLRFHRDPFLPSPADDLASGRLDGSQKDQECLLIRQEDKGMVTDGAALLLRQVKYCRFKRSDRRGGSNARGRDSSLGFAGLACIHCTDRRNNIGRYFPLTAKHLADSTAKTIM